ncbi:GIP, partial [Symbiodinium necroappetens]
DISLEEDKPAPEPRAPDEGGDWLSEEDEGGGVGKVEDGDVVEDHREAPEEPEADDQEEAEIEAMKELAEPLEFMNLYMTRPLKTRKKAEALRVIQEFYIQLRSSGFPLNRLHMDRAREFQSAALETWAASRDIELTRTQGDDPLQNGAAERAARDLSKADEEAVKSWWPFAADTAAAQQQSMTMARKSSSVVFSETAKSFVKERKFAMEDLHTGVHSDRFNMKNSKNVVVTVGDFDGGGIWQEGTSPDHPLVEIESPNGNKLQGFVQPVRNRIVKVDPKKLHMSMPWTGGTKWTIIAHTIGGYAKLQAADLEQLDQLGFPHPASKEAKSLAPIQGCCEVPEFNYEARCVHDLSSEGMSFSDEEEEWQARYWMRRLLDEEEQLKVTVPKEHEEYFREVTSANEDCLRNLELREMYVNHERKDVDQWMQISRLVESEQETHGVEMLLEDLAGPLQVVYTVALEDVKQNIAAWSEAIHKEAKALLDAGALVPLSATEQKKLVDSGKLVILPAKGVFTVKPPDEPVSVDGDGQPLPRGSPMFFKRKARLVICGNFQQKQAHEDSYAGGCQIDSLRSMLVLCAVKGWRLASTDIRNAFILAPIKDEEDDVSEEVYGLMPPKVFQLAQVTNSMQLWRVDRALYGFRRSPRLWSRFRDRRLSSARIDYKGGHVSLRQSRADANVWAIVYAAEAEEIILGYLNIYVDDVLYAGHPEAIQAVQDWLTSEWKASELSWASESSAIRFLGLEIEVEYNDQQLRRAQILTGELLWLSGRSRIGLRVLGYLRETADLTLTYFPSRDGHVLDAYSDASFSPQGERAGRQSMISLSVAEAELIETVNASQLLAGTAVLTTELMGSVHGTYESVSDFNKFKFGTLLARGEFLPDGDLNVAAAATSRTTATSNTTAPADSPPTASAANGVVGLLARLVVFLGWLVQTSGAATTEGRGTGLEVSFPWELYGLSFLALVAAIGLWEALKWFCEWLSLRSRGSVEESRSARRLRRLQQAVQEEVARYGLDDPAMMQEPPVTPLARSSQSTPRPSPFRMRAEPMLARTVSVGVQTDFVEEFQPFPGPFVVSEHGDRVHYDPTCHGLRNALTRRKQLQLCHYCARRQQIYQRVG